MVESEWGMDVIDDSPSHIFALKLKALKICLKSWSKATFGAFDCFKKNCLDQIKVIDSIEKDRSLPEEEKSRRGNLRREFQLMAIKEEVYWNQRSRIRWLK